MALKPKNPKEKKRVGRFEPVSSFRTTSQSMLNIFLISFSLILGLIMFDFAKVAISGFAFGEDLRSRALDLYISEDIVQSKRGSIYDRNGLALAEELKSYTLYANMNTNYGGGAVTDFKATAQALSEHISLSAEEIEARFTEAAANNRSQIEFGAAGRGLSYVQRTAIDELNLSGIGFNESSTRFYSNGIFASHTLGYSVYDDEQNKLVGHMGLELYFDEVLSGQNGLIHTMRDRKGYLLPNTSPVVVEEAVQGYNIKTTLDFSIQNLLEDSFTKVDEEFNPASMIGVVADAKTGELLAVANRDTFDPNIRDVDNYYNPLSQNPFEPGSTFKIYTYAAAINEGLNTSNYAYPTGSLSVAGMNIKDWKPGGWGALTLDQGFYISSNTSILNILTKHLDTNKFIEYLEAFGFGNKTGIELPGEAVGTLPRKNEYANHLTSGFGQGLLTTPIQHIQAMTAIINDGNLIQPTIVSEIEDPNTGEIVYKHEATVKGTPITAETAKKVRELMYGVVHDKRHGSGYAAYRMDDIAIAGKTGTAQIADTENGGYLRGSNDYIYSFVGFAPYEDPEYIFYFAIQQPEPGRTGGHGILGEIVKNLVGNTIGQTSITQTSEPIENVKNEMVEIENYKNQTTEEASASISNLGLIPVVLGDGELVYNQSPSPYALVPVGSRVLLQSASQFAIPDMLGWSFSEVTQLATLGKLKVSSEGKGVVVSQSIPSGTVPQEGDTLHVILGEPIEENEVEEDIAE